MKKTLKIFAIIAMLSFFISITSTTAAADDNLTRETLPDSVKDGDWFSNGSKIIFSSRVEFHSYSSLTDDNRTFYRFKLFMMNANESDKIEIVVNKSNIDSEDLVAPIVSPNGQRIAFVATRNDHLSRVYTMDPDGSDVQRVHSGSGSGSLAFTWLSDKEILLWDSNDATFYNFSMDILSKGNTYIVDINAEYSRELAEAPEQLLEGKFVSSWHANTEGDAVLVKDLLRGGYTFPTQTENNNQVGPRNYSLEPIIALLMLGTAAIFVIYCFGGGEGSFGGGGGSSRDTYYGNGDRYDIDDRCDCRTIETGDHYDRDGRYIGRTTGAGDRYDEDGRYIGRTTGAGDRYDRDGRHIGRTTKDGDHYDEDGRHIGRTTKDGDSYDEDGRHIGRTTKAG